ncbi:OsmC family peroxiredoxin [Hanamia caeni]|jgi:putative redox protein|uniref:OsmC family peroxiredoxin n=1 Tax=Hanamia caeni TaxID=2294116 RepID=A0A3M9NI13_9BACT|nr:OsmC family protein [Hanamia caeni]RNI37424.1 OsmC family peroxiredoxin [Hanamia caeni]
MAQSSINAVFNGGMNFTADLNGHQLEIDTEESRGGNNKGTRPKVLMLASLAGCTGLDVVGILNKMRVNFTNLSIKVDAHLTDEEAAIYDEVTVNYSIKVDKADEQKVEKAVKLSQEKYCGVTKMFEAFAKVSYKIIYL